MTPLEQAMDVYQHEPCGRTFSDDLTLHLIGGFVFSTPEFFVMGRPVVSTAPAAAITEPTQHFPREACDCWHIFLAAGDRAKIWSVLPWELPLISFERKNDLRIYPLSRIRALLLR